MSVNSEGSHFWPCWHNVCLICFILWRSIELNIRGGHLGPYCYPTAISMIASDKLPMKVRTWKWFPGHPLSPSFFPPSGNSHSSVEVFWNWDRDWFGKQQCWVSEGYLVTRLIPRVCIHNLTYRLPIAAVCIYYIYYNQSMRVLYVVMVTISSYIKIDDFFIIIIIQ